MKTLLLLLLLPLKLFAQDITGVWTGILQTTGSEVPYELAISGSNDKLSGYSLTIFTFDGIENTGVKSMKLKNKKGTISIEDGELIYNNYSTQPKRVKLSGTLSLIIKDSVMTLIGTFSTRTIDFRSTDQTSFKGIIRLQKKNNFTQTKLISKLGEMNLLNLLSFMQPKIKEKETVSMPPKESSPLSQAKQKVPVTTSSTVKNNVKPPAQIKEKQPAKTLQPIAVNTAADLEKRKTEIIRNVFFKSDSLVIKLYDNGEIDGDTVSVILNGKVIISKQELTARAITTTIYITPDLGDSLELIMYAENLGRIPPNTGLLTLMDGDNRYDIRFSGDFQKNSAIVLKRKH
jgi:hypothetical protein